VQDTLLPTKLLIPQTRPELVKRSRLIQELNDGLHHALTLISAPAGFGKSTLAAKWVNELQSGQSRQPATKIAWLALSEADNDFNRFMTYFFKGFSGLKDLDAHWYNSTRDLLQTTNLPPVETLFSPLITALSSSNTKTVFVLDDYHLIENLTIHKAINFWLENTPSQVHTVVITREDPPFPLARLRVRGQITEIREKALRFTTLEATQFLNEMMGLQLDNDSIATLEEKTEGWIAGLQMAALSMRDRKDISTFIQNFSGTHRFILDYLLEEVLANQPTEIEEFLLKTSILRRLSSPLCDALLGTENQTSAILAQLEQANLFLIPLDDERKWYRYHHLFSDLLTARSKQILTTDEISKLHSRAARWFEENGMAYGAIYHASLIPDDEWVERIIDNNYMEIFQRKDSVSIRNWTGELGKDLIFKRPQLAIHEANSRAWFGLLEDADQLLAEAEKRLNSMPASPEIDAMFGYIDYVKSRVTGMHGDFEQAIQLGLLAQARTAPDNQGLLGGIGVMLGYAYFLNGDFPNAIQTLQETIDNGKMTGAINTTIGAYCVLARLYAIQGHLQKSYRLYQEAERFIQQSEGDLRGAMSIVDVGYAEILYEWNRLEEAATHIQQGLEFLPRWSKADDFALAYVIQSQIQMAQGEPLLAQRTVQKASNVIQTSGVFSEARDIVLSAEIKQLLSTENKTNLLKEVRSLEERKNSQQPFHFKNELAFITLARLYQALNQTSDCLDLLSQLETSARSSGRTGRLIQIMIMQTLAYAQSHEPGKANRYLSASLAMAEPEAHQRIILDEGTAMQNLLRDWLVSAENSPSRLYAQSLLSQFSSQSVLPSEAQAQHFAGENLIEPLSPREIEVLSLIADGKTNKEIAQQLIVSPGTIKAHTSNIYRKLDVANRTEAVARARQLSILS
jgi:LuxR family maltose regulon positive regulatory protein